MRILALTAILAAAGATAVILEGNASGPVVASVDGVDISREAYREYALVFTTPNGTLRVSEKDVLLSLINQALVQRHADRLGIVISDQDVAHSLDDLQGRQEAGGLSVGFLEDAAFRQRLRLVLVFKRVKAAVVGDVEVSSEQIRAAYAADPRLRILGFADAAVVLRDRLAREESDRRWLDWLQEVRSCSDIRIFDTTFGLPSSTPAPGCADATT